MVSSASHLWRRYRWHLPAALLPSQCVVRHVSHASHASHASPDLSAHACAIPSFLSIYLYLDLYPYLYLYLLSIYLSIDRYPSPGGPAASPGREGRTRRPALAAAVRGPREPLKTYDVQLCYGSCYYVILYDSIVYCILYIVYCILYYIIVCSSPLCGLRGAFGPWKLTSLKGRCTAPILTYIYIYIYIYRERERERDL